MTTTVELEFRNVAGDRVIIPAGESVELVHPSKAGHEIRQSVDSYRRNGRNCVVVILRGQFRILDRHMVQH